MGLVVFLYAGAGGAASDVPRLGLLILGCEKPATTTIS